MKNLIIYYSYTGNTKKIANIIKDKLPNSDIAEIKTKIPYSSDYNSVVSQGKKEVKKGFMPEILPIDIDINNYENIIIGSPVWWYTFAPAVLTFLNNYNLSGKKIYPFITNGGWIGHTFDDIKNLCRSSEMKEGINIYFNNSKLITDIQSIYDWIEKIK